MRQAALTPATILVVEDDATIQAMLRDMLTLTGYNALLAGSGQAAFTILAQNKVDAVILDIQLPDTDGIVVCQRIRAMEQGHLPIVIASADRSHATIAEAMAVGADAYLIKPFQPDLLLQQLKVLLGQAPD